jgi:predicted DNA-binding protein (MmcQ/YjbR family)
VDVTQLHALCAGFPGAWPDNPWDHDHPVFKVGPAYIGRSGWNDHRLAGAIPGDELVEAVEESYRLVVSKLPKKDRPAGWEG